MRAQRPSAPMVMADHRAHRDLRRPGADRVPADGRPDAATLETLLEHLGPSIIDIIAAPRGIAMPIRAPVIYDATAPPHISPGDILLAVGVAVASAGSLELIELAARSGAVAVAFKGRSHLDLLATDADRAGLAAVVLPDELGWDDLYGMLRGVIAAAASVPAASTIDLGGPPLNDLSALANAAASNLGGLVTIHNHRLQVVAFSTLDQPMDELGQQSILRRMPPDWYADWLKRSGTMSRLFVADGPIAVEAPGALPRMVLAVRANRETLGWVSVVVDPAVGPVDEAILTEVARVASLELVRLRGVEDIDRRLRAEVFRAALDSRGSAMLLSGRLGVEPESPCWLVALHPRVASGGQLAGASLLGLRDLAALRAEALDRRTITVAHGEQVYALLPGERLSRDVVRHLATETIAHAARTLQIPVAGVYGELVDGLPELAAAAGDAVRALRRMTADMVCGPQAWDEFSAQDVLSELEELVVTRPRLLRGPIAALAETDGAREDSQLETLRTFLECSCDFTAASARLHVHRNTLRYRIQRITERTGLDLLDPTQRLVAELQLRLVASARARAQAVPPPRRPAAPAPLSDAR